MGIEDLGGMGGFPGLDPAMAGMDSTELQQQMVAMMKSTLADLQKSQRDRQAQITDRHKQVVDRKKGTAKLSPEQLQQWKQIEAAVMANPEFIEPIGLSLAGLIRNQNEVSSIIKEFPDMRFAMAQFLREEAARRREASQAAAPAAASSQPAPVS